MTDRLPDSDPDRRLAQRLDAGHAPDGSDPLHPALDAARRPDAPVARATSDRLWARVEAEIDAPARRPVLRILRPAVAVAAAVVLAVAAGLWWSAPQPEVVAVAEATVETFAAPDGSTITLRPHTELVRLGERAYAVEGEAYFAVASDPERPFTVEAGVGAVEVLGTRFVASTWGGRTDVFVEEGRVRVSGPGEAVVLTAGAGATVTEAGVVRRPDASAEAALDWRRGALVFEAEPARRVADELGQQFGVAVTLPTAVAAQTVTGTLPLADRDAAFDALGRILGGRFEASDSGVRFVAR